MTPPSNNTAHDKSAAARPNIALGKNATVEAYVKANMEGCPHDEYNNEPKTNQTPTDMICASADKTAIPPNKAPTSELNPAACRQTAPSECNAGLPPEVNDDKHDRPTKICGDDGVMVIRVSATQSNAKEHWARYLSNLSSAVMCSALR